LLSIIEMASRVDGRVAVLKADDETATGFRMLMRSIQATFAAFCRAHSPSKGLCVSPVPSAAISNLVPTRKLRVTINLGNMVLAQKDPVTGEPRGVTAELARGLGKRLDVPVTLIPFDAAGKVFEAVKTGGASPPSHLFRPLRQSPGRWNRPAHIPRLSARASRSAAE
jgi:hypothetical protein